MFSNKSYYQKYLLKILLLTSILLFMAILIGCEKDDISIVGVWQGAIVIDEQELDISVNFKESEDGLRATIDIPQQNIKNYALENLEYDHPNISFELPSTTTGKFIGEKDGSKITGEYTQGQFKGEFYLNEVDDANNIVEDQDKSDEGNSEEVSLDVEAGRIYGTLTLADNNDEKTPVVLIIAGSGPTDRNGNSTIAGENNSLKMIADFLADNGVASLRYDKRGIAESAAIKIDEKDLRFEDYINDAAGWLEILKQDQRFSNIYVLGHSQGSLVGMLAAQKVATDGFISVAGSGQSIANTLREQLANLPQELKEKAENILLSLEKGEIVSEVDQNLQGIFRPSVQPFLISYMKYDPALEISKLDVPVLIIQGTTDLQVSKKDAEKLKNAYPEARLEIIEGMNHILKEAPADPQENAATYSNPDLPLADEFKEVLISWLELR